MYCFDRVKPLQAQLLQWRGRGERVGFVPTMGNLHRGHRSLIAEAKKRCQRLVVSIFVNPTQFAAGEDYAAYPRTIEADKEVLVEDGVDLLFSPEIDELYRKDMARTTMVSIAGLGGELCGAHRKGHFDGVLTVVNKFLNIVQPEMLFLGEKDFQQLFLIRQMVADLFLPVEVVGVPTCRDNDGLALSSRNQYLSSGERQQATRLYQVLCQIKSAIEAGERDFAGLEIQARDRLRAAGFKPDYVEVRRRQDLAPAQPHDRELVVLAAATLGRARLIDNLAVSL